MALSIPSGVKIEYDNGSDTLVDITQYVLSVNDFDVETITEEKHTFGDSWEEHLPIGLGRVPIIEIGGLYDDTASVGPDALFANRAPETPTSTTRTLKITWRTGKTTSIETYLITYRRSADRNAVTKFTARLQPSGAPVEV